MNRVDRSMGRSYLAPFTLLIALSQFSCSSSKLTEEPSRQNRKPSTELLALTEDRYIKEIHPIFSSRCVVCHTCVDAPCQLHLDSYTGTQRGATHSAMGSNLFEVNPTRDKDAKTTQEWRDKGFFAVLQERNIELPPATPDENLKDSILYTLIEQGFQHNQAGFDLHALEDHYHRDNLCVATPELARTYRERYPSAGMPYGLPALDLISFETLKNWIADGAPGPSEEATHLLQEPSHPEILDEWNQFLNGSLKARLAARFIYEHAFMAHIHFEGTPDQEFYEIVRSRTPFPEAIDEIVTPRPYDAPKAPIYYRFKKVAQTIVRKTHILWELGPHQLQALRNLFLETPWTPQDDSQLIDPGYQSTNPFEYFSQIPAEVRYRFMIQNSRLIVNSMIRGPVCSGRIATNAIRDHFWVFFLDPAADVTVREPTIGRYEWAPLGEKLSSDLPAARKNYNRAMERYKPEGFSISDIWKGDGTNRNAVLSILRHETSATVYYGPLGGEPRTAWILNFSNFERIYYNLVVDFKPWGNQFHKLATWNTMSTHRSEAEERFISFLPKKFRKQARSEWTHGLGGVFENYTKKSFSDGIRSQVSVEEIAPIQNLLRQLIGQMSPKVLGDLDPLSEFPKLTFEPANEIRSIEDWEKTLSYISQKKDLKFPQFMPNILFFRIEDKPYTLITHRAYAFNNLVTLNDLAYEPDRDIIAAFRGLYGDRPELFIDLSLRRANLFIKNLLSVKTESDWNILKNTYAIRRNNPRFWELLDWFHSWDQKSSPLEAGVFDVSQYDIP